MKEGVRPRVHSVEAQKDAATLFKQLDVILAGPLDGGQLAHVDSAKSAVRGPHESSQEVRGGVKRSARKETGKKRATIRPRISENDEEPEELDLEKVAADYEPETPLAIYLRDIGKIKLLNADEEVELANQRDAGKRAKEKLATGTIGVEREELEEIIAKGDDAKRRLVEANLRLAVSVARKYIGKGLPFMDLIQEGNKGLLRATEKFEQERGNKFSTYATWWIRQGVTRALAEQARTIRVPVHVGGIIRDINDASAELTNELERQPTASEIAARLGMEPRRILEVIQAMKQPISLETTVGDEEKSVLADFVADESQHAPELVSARVLSEQYVTIVRGTVSDREWHVLELRFGFEDGRQRTLDEVGEELQVTRERVRQIEQKALRKLRTPENALRLRELR